ncbi:hypothetical protein HK104_007289 [Borealophlyctis nickersoniae]|nr:hypothetical protein HK104_007289 [Borealophlyctis nickersoniae]
MGGETRGAGVANRDLWEKLDEFVGRHGCVRFYHIPRELNTEVDRLARLGVAKSDDLFPDTDEEVVHHTGMAIVDDSYYDSDEELRSIFAETLRM